MKHTAVLVAFCSLAAFAEQIAVLHKVNPKYPPASKLQKIEGLVTVAVEIDERGLVTEARVLGGPRELRRAAEMAALDWQYVATGKQAQATIDFNFTLAREQEKPARGILKAIEFSGVTPEAEARLRPRLILKEGDEMPAGAEEALRQVVAEAEPRLFAYLTSDNRLVIETRPETIRVGGNVQSTKLEHAPRPQYPPEAKQARIQGTVRFDAQIDKFGNVSKLDVIGGHPLLVEAALAAVRQWRYQTTLLNGNPVEVATRIDVNFTLLP